MKREASEGTTIYRCYNVNDITNKLVLQTFHTIKCRGMTYCTVILIDNKL